MSAWLTPWTPEAELAEHATSRMASATSSTFTEKEPGQNTSMIGTAYLFVTEELRGV